MVAAAPTMMLRAQNFSRLSTRKNLHSHSNSLRRVDCTTSSSSLPGTRGRERNEQWRKRRLIEHFSSLVIFFPLVYVAKHCRKLSSGRLFRFYWVVHKLSNKNGFEHLSRGAQGESGRKKKGMRKIGNLQFQVSATSMSRSRTMCTNAEKWDE